jgi:tetratricopeptide (TPR) repeat protein
MDLSGLQYPPPNDAPAFERLTRRVFARLLSMPQLNGRSGQEQHGADIFARDGDGFVVIQCKLKDELAAEPDLRLSKFCKDARDAREKFKPNLCRFILVTTAPNDAKLQECARELTAEFQSDAIEVQFYGWDEMRVAIGENVELREDYLGETGYSALSSKVDSHHDTTSGKLDELLRLARAPADLASPQLKRQLDRIKTKIENGRVRVALEDLQSLREMEWQDASTENRFVILTQLGSAHWELGDRDKAVPLFIEASTLLPDHKVGLANLAASYTVSGKPAAAIAAAKRLLEIDPDNGNGLLALIQAQEQLDPTPDPLDVVPIALRASEEAYLGAIQVLRNRSDDRWLTLAREGVERHPDSDLLQKVSADSVLHRLAREDGVHAGAHSKTAPTWDEVNVACSTLEQQWVKHIACDPSEVDASLAQNLAQLMRALDRIEDAVAVLERVGTDSEPAARVTTLRGMLLAASGRQEDALIALDARLDVLANRMLSAHLSTDPGRVRQLLADGDWSIATQDERMWRAILDTEARAKIEQDFDPLPQFRAVADEHPDRLMPIIALARAAPDGTVADDCASLIIAALSASTPFSDLLHAALWCHETNRLKEVVALLGGRVAPDIDSQGLHWLIQALLNLNERAVLKTLLERVSEPLASSTKFLEYRAYSAFNSGDMPQARTLITSFLARDPLNLRARMLWVQVMMRQQDGASIDAWLSTSVEQLAGSVEDRAQLGHLIASRGQFERGQRFAYRLARSNPDNKMAQERFLAVVLLNPVAPATPIVAPGAVFTIVDESGVEQVFRLEDEADLPTETMDLRPSSPLAEAAAGHAEGDEIRLASQLRSVPDKVFRVSKIVHARAYYFNHLGDVMPTRFPGPVMMHKFTIDPETGAGLDVILNTMTSNGDHVSEAIDAYNSSGASIRLLAHAIQRDGIDTYEALVQTPSAFFLACDGPETSATDILTRNNARGCLVDTLTAELVRRHGLLDIVTATLGRMVISQATLDDFIERSERDRQLGSLYKAGTLQRIDGKAVCIEEHAALRDISVEDRRGALAWVRANTRVVPAAGISGLAGHLHAELPDSVRGALIDDMLAAAQASLPILSDDQGYRRLSTALAGLEAVGLTAVLMVALEAGVIERPEYVEKLSRLAEAQHHALAIGALDIVVALTVDGGVLGRSTRALISQLGGQNADIKSHLVVAISALRHLWSAPEHRCNRLQLILLVADRLLEAFPTARTKFGAAVLRDPDAAVTLLEYYVTNLAAREPNEPPQ